MQIKEIKDLNKVELIGHISHEISYRKNEKGSWATSVMDVVQDGHRLYVNLSFFDADVIKRVEELKLHAGSKVHIVGSLFIKNSYKKMGWTSYTSIIVKEIETI